MRCESNDPSSPRAGDLILLVNDRRLRDLCWIAGERHLVFRAADEPAVRRALRELGYALPPPG
jgi:hypothetical protein